MEMVFTSVLLGVGLAMDAFAVSLGVGTGNSAPMRRSKLRLALHFGIFQGLMTIVGWLLGSTVVDLIDQFDHWIAFGLLLLVGGRMISAGFKPEVETFNTDPSKGGLLILLSLATSMDALAVGLSMAMIGTSIIMPALIIGVVTFTLSSSGLFFGYMLGQKFGKRMEIVGGLILIAIGVRVVWTHLS